MRTETFCVEIRVPDDVLADMVSARLDDRKSYVLIELARRVAHELVRMPGAISYERLNDRASFSNLIRATVKVVKQ